MEENKRPYKIMLGDKVKVLRTEVKNFVFYKTEVSQKQPNGKLKKYYKRLTFKKDVDLPNNSFIILNNFFENIVDNKYDKYNPISVLFVEDFEIVTDSAEKKEAIKEFQKNLKNDTGFMDSYVPNFY